MSITAKLSTAIKEQRVVVFTYHGALRIVHPHVVWGDQTDKLTFEGWQVDGESRSRRKLPGWIHCPVLGMADLRILDQSFDGPREDYHPARFQNIICCLPLEQQMMTEMSGSAA